MFPHFDNFDGIFLVKSRKNMTLFNGNFQRKFQFGNFFTIFSPSNWSGKIRESLLWFKHFNGKFSSRFLSMIFLPKMCDSKICSHVVVSTKQALTSMMITRDWASSKTSRGASREKRRKRSSAATSSSQRSLNTVNSSKLLLQARIFSWREN